MPNKKERDVSDRELWQMLVDHAKWFGRWTDAAQAIAEYLADRPTADAALTALIQQWKLIRQEDQWGHLHTPLKVDDMTKEFSQWRERLYEAGRAIADYVAIRPVSDPVLAELASKYLEISNENGPTRDELAKLRRELHAD